LPFSPEFDPLNGISCRASADSLDQIRERTEFMRAVFVDCTEELAKVIKARALQIPDSLEIYSGALSRMELIGCCQGADVLLVEHTMLRPEVFDVCPSVRSVIFLGTGAGSYIDLSEAARRGISVVTTPGMATVRWPSTPWRLYSPAPATSPGWAAK
jgi:hypothetical protein